MAASSRAEGAKRTAGLLGGLAKGWRPVSRRYPAYDVGQRDCVEKGIQQVPRFTWDDGQKRKSEGERRELGSLAM